MDDVVDELRKAIAKGNPESADDILMMSRQYSPIVIDKKNFHAIISDDHPQCMLFVDGGNSIIFECPNFCLGYIRVAAIRYKNNVRQSNPQMNSMCLLQKMILSSMSRHSLTHHSMA